MLAIDEKRKQVEVCQKLIDVMNKIIPSKSQKEENKKLRFRFRRNRKNRVNEEGVDNDNDKNLDGDQEPTPIEELLEYLYEKYTDLFKIDGDTKDRMMLELEPTLTVIDNIPDELLERCTKPREKAKRDAEIQTLMTMN